MPTPDFNFLIYKTAEEDITVNAVIRDETIWLTQKAMAELFGVQAPAISKQKLIVICSNFRMTALCR